MTGFEWLFFGLWLVLVGAGVALALWHDGRRR